VSRVLVTGSADGLGRAAAQSLIDSGHDVVVHARSDSRGEALRPLVDAGASLVVGDLAELGQLRGLVDQLDGTGPFDAVIHNAGVYSGPAVMPVNVVAPYLLTALLPRPGRVVWLSSGSHFGGRAALDDVDWGGTRAGSYSDSKLFVTTLAAAVARLWPDVPSNAVDPGWVPTRMGGPGAPDDLELGHVTQVWLATSDDAQARTSGGYWFHQRRRDPHPAVHDTAFQDRLLAVLAQHTGSALRA
jgi:NAD(P)-dependent dehydrogenase (short-subunit alcohol dehydrogenase family)